MKLSILTPVYNQLARLEQIIRRAKALNVDKKNLLVDDCATGDPGQLLENYENQINRSVIYHDKNFGKDRAVRPALAHSTGEVVVMQGADLGYDPTDLPTPIRRIQRGEKGVKCSPRRLKKDNSQLLFTLFIGGETLNWIICRMYHIRTTDYATCDKMVRVDLLRFLCRQWKRFEFYRGEIAKLAKRKTPIVELPIAYTPRTIEDGHQFCWREGVETLWTSKRYNFSA